MRLRVLTFNVGLMRLRVGGLTVFENPVGVDRRAPLVLTRIRDTCRAERVDIVCIQECYEQDHRDMLKVALRPEYPFMATSHFHTWMNSGIITFSKHPILSFRRVPHSRQCGYERVFGDRAMLVTRIAPDGDLENPVLVVNAHLSSGCPDDTVEMMAIRHEQISDIDRTIESERADAFEPVIVAGDFNCGPQVCPRNYAEMVRLGWVDAWVAANGTGAQGITWNKSNSLNVHKPSLQGRSQRCDQVWVARSDGPLTVHGCRVFIEADPSSDHYAVTADISIKQTSPIAARGAARRSARFRTSEARRTS